jgi:hypothetical protein
MTQPNSKAHWVTTQYTQEGISFFCHQFTTRPILQHHSNNTGGSFFKIKKGRHQENAFLHLVINILAAAEILDPRDKVNAICKKGTRDVATSAKKPLGISSECLNVRHDKKDSSPSVS